MGFWDVVTGRSRPKQAKLDALFAVPGAAVTLQAALGLVPTGDGSVCYRAAPGAGFAGTQQDILALLQASDGAPRVTTTQDSYGFTWLEVDHDPIDPANPDLTGLCTDLHGVNTTLELNGYGSGLLCSVIPFTSPDRRSVGLVYLYKQGTFYPFAPSGPDRRDNLLEISVRDAVGGELPLEKDLSRWLALWGAPGLG
ncbi:PspA-associated protein PspAB [Nocardioides cheoyonin]|uniref:PspA-associated protein PspAB n=1 Tax=Nocardioides cheoyonin TaxID=3156615 RepID=UPI0032B50B7D